MLVVVIYQHYNILTWDDVISFQELWFALKQIESEEIQ